MATYDQDDIRIQADVNGKTANLLFTFSYGTDSDGRRLRFRTTTGKSIPAKHWVEGDFSPAFKASREFTKLSGHLATKQREIIAAYDAHVTQTATQPTPEQLADAIRGVKKATERIKMSDFTREYAATKSHPLTAAKYRTLADMIDYTTELCQGKAKRFTTSRDTPYLHTWSEVHHNDLSEVIKRAACRLGDTIKDRGIDAVQFVGDAPDLLPTYGINTLEKYQQCVRAVINHAKRTKRVVNVEATALHKVPKVDPEQTCLDLDELATLINAAPFGEDVVRSRELNDARRIFIVMCLTGVAIGDIRQFLAAPIDAIRGRSILFRSVTYTRAKTGITAMVPLTAPVLDVLSSDVPPVMPKFDQQLCDDIKLVCKKLGLDRTVIAVVPKADGSKPIERGPLHEVVHPHMGRATCKTLWQEELECDRALVCSIMAHVLPKDADMKYARMPRERKAEKVYLMARMEADKLPFPFMAVSQLDAAVRRA